MLYKSESYYKIIGGQRLEGEVVISGAKNAAVAIIPAAILAGAPCRLENIPDIEDVTILIDILRRMGTTVEELGDGVLVIDPRTITSQNVTYEMVGQLRASYYLLGAMLGAFGQAKVAQPGGCTIGERPMDQHIKGFKALGATVQNEKGIWNVSAEKLVGAEIYLDVVSVGATINIMLAACRAEGLTVINNAAKEPHVVDVANFLNMMGASIKGAGTDIIRIMGREKLHGCTYGIIPDQIEAGTYMVAAAATGGDVIVRNVIPTHLEAISAKLMESGITVIEGDDGREFFMRVKADSRPRAVNVKTLPYPGFPTDLQQPFMALLCVAQGNSFVMENIFADRFNQVTELRRMGANITVSGRTAMIEGVEQLTGAPLYATDLRAGAALVIAALMGKGESRVYNIEYIDRGYENLEKKLKALGANIERVEKQINLQKLLFTKK